MSNHTIPYFATHFLSFEPSVQQEQLERFKGICALYGYESFLRLQNAHVVVIGNGGVGSWLAESLCRIGVGSLTLVDFDNIELSNSNRQLHTLSSTITQSKCITLGNRLKDINPYLNLRTFPVLLDKNNIYSQLDTILNLKEGTLLKAREENLKNINAPHIIAQEKFLAQNNKNINDIPNNLYVAEAIDDLFAKASCVDAIHRASIPLVSSGGAGGRIDPNRLRLGDITEARGDQLIKRLRTELRRHYNYPKGIDNENIRKVASRNCRSHNCNNAHAVDPKFNILCTYSDEIPMRSIHRTQYDRDPSELGLNKDILPKMPQFGASVTVTASAGLLISSVIVRWIVGSNIEYNL